MAEGLRSDIKRDNVVFDEKTGHYFIPASQRPDGSWRKPIRVREGYVPPDEVPKYESRGSTWRKPDDGYNPGFPPGYNPVPDEPAKSKPKSGKTKKSENPPKQQQQQQQQKQQEKTTSGAKAAQKATAKAKPIEKDMASMSLNSKEKKANTGGNDDGKETPNELRMKKIRKLKKILKQIEELEEKLESGDLSPDRDQIEKMNRKSAIEAELKELQSSL